jgi:hypothetical protein
MRFNWKLMSIDLKIKQFTVVEVEKHILPKIKITNKFGIFKSTMSTIIKNKYKIDKKQLRLVKQTM